MNIEAKRGQDLIQAESQYSKNLRINQAIYLAARQRGVVLETIPFLDIRGNDSMWGFIFLKEIG